MIDISVNGESRQIDESLTVAVALTRWNYECGRVAVAINSEFVPRAEYERRCFSIGDKVDIVAPVAGG